MAIEKGNIDEVITMMIRGVDVYKRQIQTLAGVTENGFSSTGFYVGFLLL